jgi:hypothetical protein
MQNPEPVTLEQALFNAVMWATKAGTLAIEQKRDGLAGGIAVAASGLKRALAMEQREVRGVEAR